MPERDRIQGYYWVRRMRGLDSEVALWLTGNKKWLFPGDDHRHSDNSLVEIDERRIERAPPGTEPSAGQTEGRTVATCATCRHWRNKHDSDIPGVKKCYGIPALHDATEWQDDEPYARVLTPEFSGAKAFAVDGSSYYAALVTLADFGCVMHESAPATVAGEVAEG